MQWEHLNVEEECGGSEDQSYVCTGLPSEERDAAWIPLCTPKTTDRHGKSPCLLIVRSAQGADYTWGMNADLMFVYIYTASVK